jgi:hypothetical protein
MGVTGIPSRTRRRRVDRDLGELIDWITLVVGLIFVARLIEPMHRNRLDIGLAALSGAYAFWAVYGLVKGRTRSA